MKPLKDYSYLKGFNHGLRYDNYSHEQTVKEMGYAKRITLNSCRLFLGFGYWLQWKKVKTQFLESLKDFVRTAWEYGISTTPILLMPFFTEGQTQYWISPDHSNSPMPGCYFKENYHIAEEIIADIIAKLKDEPGLLFWDVMNEPSWHGCLLSVDDPEEKGRRYEMVWDFVRHFIKFVREKDPINALGVGHTFIEDTELSKTGDMVDIIIFHDYLETRNRIEATCKRAVEISEKYGKPIINNETGCLCRANPYDVAIQMAEKYRIGWYIFELMITEGMWQKVHGIFYPDGTIRDPSIVAAVMGCYRNRGDSAVYPDVNQEGHAEKALLLAKKALDTRATTEALLEAAEYMANLLEAGEFIPMALPPTAVIERYRRKHNMTYAEVRAFTYKLVRSLTEACEIMPGDRYQNTSKV
jgi:hypothetical protein